MSDERPTPRIDAFLGEPTRRLEDWRWLWAEDRTFPIRSHRGILGRALVAFKRLLRPLVQTPQNDLWERQRVFNLILLEHLQREDERTRDKLLSLEARIAHVEAVIARGLDDVMRHNDALFARVDQKLDRYRRETKDLLAKLGAALARAETEDSAAPIARAHDELQYLAFEGRFRGTEEEVAARLAPYRPILEGASPVLDLGCGRGESLAVFRDWGLVARGVDASAEMVAHGRERGLDVVEADLLQHLAAAEPGSLGAVVSFHVVEHLPPPAIERLVRLAWAALRAGGVMILETPNPLSLVVAAQSFWTDPTHLRPVHPDWLADVARRAGFASVERRTFRPFAAEERLPEVPPDGWGPEVAPLVDRVNALRDRLDDLLHADRDVAIVARKAGSREPGLPA